MWMRCFEAASSDAAAPLQQALRQRLLTFLTCRRGSQVPHGSDARPLDAAMSSQVSPSARPSSNQRSAHSNDACTAVDRDEPTSKKAARLTVAESNLWRRLN